MKDQEGTIKDIIKIAGKIEGMKNEDSRVGLSTSMKMTFNATAKDLLHSLGPCLEKLKVCMENQTLFR